MVLAAKQEGNIIYTVRLQMNADPYDTSRQGEPRGIQKHLSFDETIVDRKTALDSINKFFDELEAL